MVNASSVEMRMRPLIALFVTFLTLCASTSAVHAASRIKDIVDIEGVRKNQLVGYGLVVGLNGSGDTVRNSPMLKQSMESMMGRLDVNIRDASLNIKNAAVVMVTAELPPFAVPGSHVDVTVSAMGDAKSLLGGTLLVTPLLGADGETYVAAQGSVQTGSVSAGGASGSSITKGVPTAGRIASGGIIERETGFDFNAMPIVRLTLKNPDFTTAKRIADTVNKTYPGTAFADNSTVVSVRNRPEMNMMSFISAIEQLPVTVDTAAKVVIDEVNGVIVIGENVRISRVAIAQGNLTIRVDERPFVSQPAPFSQGQTAAVPDSNVSIEEEKGKKLYELQETTSLTDLVNGLNALGVSPRDMISILQTIKASGALQADIEVM